MSQKTLNVASPSNFIFDILQKKNHPKPVAHKRKNSPQPFMPSPAGFVWDKANLTDYYSALATESFLIT